MASRMVESGRLSLAASVLGGESKVADITEETLAALDSKHPVGETSPFGPTIGPTQGLAPNRGDIQTALESFRTDVAPGIPGWTVPLLRLASRSPHSSNSSPSSPRRSARARPPADPCSAPPASPLSPRQTAGSDRLPVENLSTGSSPKPSSGRRSSPTFWRSTSSGYPPNPSKGGVESIVRAIERALAGTLDHI